MRNQSDKGPVLGVAAGTAAVTGLVAVVGVLGAD